MPAYEDMKVSELREKAKDAGISGSAGMRKADLVEALQDHEHGGGPDQRPTGGEQVDTDLAASSHEIKGDVRGQRITSVEDHEDHPGATLVTTDHDVIRKWAEERDAVPATVPGSEHDGHVGVLRFDFPGYGGRDLEHISWEKFFETFEARGLNFLYQEHKKDGAQSNFFRFQNPNTDDTDGTS